LGKRIVVKHTAVLDLEAEAEATRLKKISEEITRVAKRLARSGATPHRNEVTPELVKAAIRARAARAEHLPKELFHDPAWDLLLELFLAHLEDRQLQISALGIGAGIAPATVLRWLGQLESIGLIRRHPAPEDGRRIYIGLTEKAVRALHEYFSPAPSMWRLAV
jgi:predicted Rossmann fold nucleotide-binding protein DprA/Smf involved in DNA uptake